MPKGCLGIWEGVIAFSGVGGVAVVAYVWHEVAPVRKLGSQIVGVKIP